MGMRPERFASVVRPLRTGLWRLLRPSMLLVARELRVLAERIDAEVRTRTELAERADIADARLLDSERRIIELRGGNRRAAWRAAPARRAARRARCPRPRRWMTRLRVLWALPSTDRLHSAAGTASLELAAQLARTHTVELAVDDSDPGSVAALGRFCEAHELALHVGTEAGPPALPTPSTSASRRCWQGRRGTSCSVAAGRTRPRMPPCSPGPAGRPSCTRRTIPPPAPPPAG